MKKTPTRHAPLSHAAALLRRRELEQLDVVRAGPDRWVINNPENYLFVTTPIDMPELRLYRRDVLITRETARAPRNALVGVIHEAEGKSTAWLGLWERGGERVLTLRLPDDGGGFERVFLREELTYIGQVVGYIRREWRNATVPQVRVYKGGAA